MVEQKIEFRKIRDFGEILNDTFLFIRQNFRFLFKSFFAISAIVMIALAIFYGVYESQSLHVFDDILYGTEEQGNFIRRYFSLGYLAMVLILLATFVAMKVAVGAYVKYYVENNGNRPGIEDVWTIFKNYFFRVLLYSIPITLLSLFGCIFCLFPGVYLWVVFLPFPFVVMMEDKRFSQTYHRCFELISDEFWSSFAIYVVGFLIYLISSKIIEGLFGLIFDILQYFTTRNLDVAKEKLVAFLNIFSLSFYIIFYLCVAFQYFNLVEKKDGTGLLLRINSIGDNKNTFDNIEEQY